MQEHTEHDILFHLFSL